MTTCCKHKSWSDHIDGAGAELLKIWDTSWIMKSTNVDVRHLESFSKNK